MDINCISLGVNRLGRKNQAYEYLKQAIINNELPQGSALREAEISERLKMSRTPIREALRDLEAEGVVVSYPARGTFVATITPYDVEEIYELRTLFEVYALEKAIHRITDEDLDRAEANFLAENEPFNWEHYHAADRDFHQLILDRCCNRRLSGFMANLNTQVERIRIYSDKNTARSKDERLTEHLQIISCIRRRDLDASIIALKEHLRNVSNAAIETCKVLAMEDSN